MDSIRLDIMRYCTEEAQDDTLDKKVSQGGHGIQMFDGPNYMKFNYYGKNINVYIKHAFYVDSKLLEKRFIIAKNLEYMKMWNYLYNYHLDKKGKNPVLNPLGIYNSTQLKRGIDPDSLYMSVNKKGDFILYGKFREGTSKFSIAFPNGKFTKGIKEEEKFKMRNRPTHTFFTVEIIEDNKEDDLYDKE